MARFSVALRVMSCTSLSQTLQLWLKPAQFPYDHLVVFGFTWIKRYLSNNTPSPRITAEQSARQRTYPQKQTIPSWLPEHQP